jgi:hypothetical protein
MNAHVKNPTAVDPQREFVLAALRTVCKRLEHIREEVAFHGTSLAIGAIDVQTAMRWVEEVAPGCLPIEVKATFLAKGWPLP